jgi:hypothetical protein
LNLICVQKLPGETVVAKWEAAQQWGFDGIELRGRGSLNDNDGGHVTPSVARQALDSAHGGAPEEGASFRHRNELPWLQGR